MRGRAVGGIEVEAEDIGFAGGTSACFGLIGGGRLPAEGTEAGTDVADGVGASDVDGVGRGAAVGIATAAAGGRGEVCDVATGDFSLGAGLDEDGNGTGDVMVGVGLDGAGFRVTAAAAEDAFSDGTRDMETCPETV